MIQAILFINKYYSQNKHQLFLVGKDEVNWIRERIKNYFLNSIYQPYPFHPECKLIQTPSYSSIRHYGINQLLKHSEIPETPTILEKSILKKLTTYLINSHKRINRVGLLKTKKLSVDSYEMGQYKDIRSIFL